MSLEFHRLLDKIWYSKINELEFIADYLRNQGGVLSNLLVTGCGQGCRMPLLSSSTVLEAGFYHSTN